MEAVHSKGEFIGTIDKCENSGLWLAHVMDVPGVQKDEVYDGRMFLRKRDAAAWVKRERARLTRSSESLAAPAEAPETETDREPKTTHKTMRKLINVTSHTLTPDQLADAKDMGYAATLDMPAELKQKWANIDPRDPYAPLAAARAVLDWLRETMREGDAVLLAGEVRAVYCLRTRLGSACPVYAATTEREAVEAPQPDGSVKKTLTFKHVKFLPFPL